LDFSSRSSLDTEDYLVTEPTTTSAMTSTLCQGTASDAPIALASFNRWLLRALPGQELAYHRGHLIWDRSPASALGEGERRALARIADAAWQAAEEGRVHLVQRRNGPFDFSYLAVKAAPAIRPRCTSAVPPRRMAPPAAFAEAA
jgi:hypothetical protein